MINYRNALFDLDGTVVDPGLGIVNSVKFALKKLGYGINENESFRKFIGPPLKYSFEKYYGMKPGVAEQAVGFYREYFSEYGIGENKIYENITDLLKALKSKNVNVYIATSKPKIYAKKIIENFQLEQFFIAIEGSEFDGTLSDKSDLIAFIIKRHNLSVNESIMIGDREHDIIGARNNKMDSIGVGYGYGTKGELLNAGAKYYASDIYELSELLNNIFAQQGDAPEPAS